MTTALLHELSSSRQPALLGILAFVVSVMVASGLIVRSEQEALASRRAEVSDVLGDKGHEVENAVFHALTATYALAALVRQGHGAVPEFDTVATEMLRYYPGVDSLQLAPGGVVRHVVPLGPNAMAIGHDLLADPDRNKEAFLARETGKLTLAGPFPLMQGGIGAVGRLPVYLADSDGHRDFWGFTTVLIRFPDVLQRAKLPELENRGFEYQLWRLHPDTGLKQIVASSASAVLAEPVNRPLSMPNGTWTLSASPRDGWVEQSVRLVKIALGLSFSLLLGWLAKQMAELSWHRGRLQALVEERTEALATRESKLSALISSLPDQLVVMNEEGRITEIHAPDPDLLIRPQQSFVGRLYGEVLPPDVAARIRSALAELAHDGARREIEYALDLPQGRRQFSASMSQLLRGDAAPVGYLALVRDITERKKAEDGMREAMVVFDASSQGIMTADEQGLITSVNPAFCAITGYSVSEVIGEKLSLLKSDRHDRSFYEKLWASLDKTGRWEGEIWNRRKSGEVYPQWLTITAVHDAAGRLIKYVSIFSDITRRKQREELIWHQANFDALTGLANRNLLHDRLSRALAHGRRAGTRVGLMFIDLDGFKWINDTLGHDVGDEMLIEVASRLKGCMRQQDTVARLGGDEFTIVIEDVEDVEGLRIVGAKVLDALRTPFQLSGAKRFISGSIGITVFPDDGDTVQTLLRNADIAMYQSKQLGKNRCQFYSPEMQEAAHVRVRLEAELRTAIEAQQFVLHYQPIVEAATGKLVGAEALIRWRHPIRGLVLPGDFIPIAEDTGLIVTIGEWVLREATRQLRDWQAHGLAALRVAVNVSAVQFRETGLATLMDELCSGSGRRGNDLVLEITESVLMQSSDVTESRMREIGALGVGYSLDDFGTGYSSLSYLKRFPVNVVKIDRSFVHDCPDDRSDGLLVEAIINMAHSLGLRVTAEGVETEAQLAFLRERGCDYLQGFLISEPLCAEAFEGFAHERGAADAFAA